MYKAVSSEAALFQSDPFITFIFSTGGIILKPYIIKRILSAIPLLLIISFVCFVFINLIPSDPAEVALRVRQVPIITEDAIAEVRSQLGLDKPYLVRYFSWVLDCLHGDFGISYQEDVTVALASKDALPIKASAAIIQHNTSGIISLASDNIQSPKDLEGKTYATWENPVEQAVIKSLMEADGGDFSKLNLVPSTVSDVITALNTNIDTVWIFYAWDGVATELKGYDTNFMDFAKLNTTFDYYTPIIIANNDFLAENPDTAKAFLAATAKGYEYAIENPDAAADILLEAAPELDPEIVKASQEWLADQYIADAEKWGYIDPARWDGFYTWLTENNLVDGELPAGTGYSNDYLA